MKGIMNVLFIKKRINNNFGNKSIAVYKLYAIAFFINKK